MCDHRRREPSVHRPPLPPCPTRLATNARTSSGNSFTRASLVSYLQLFARYPTLKTMA